MTAGRYRKKPVVIEAMQIPRHVDGPHFSITAYVKTCIQIAKWSGGTSHMMVNDDEKAFADSPVTGPYILIPTLEGDMCARPDDFIIKGVNGEFYPCKPDIFAKTYAREDTEWPTAP
jgi:hypothetical protein